MKLFLPEMSFYLSWYLFLYIFNIFNLRSRSWRGGDGGSERELFEGGPSKISGYPSRSTVYELGNLSI